MQKYNPTVVTEKELEYGKDLFDNLSNELEIFTYNYIIYKTNLF